MPSSSQERSRSSAFAGAFWWAVLIGAVAILPVLLLPRRRSAGEVPAG
ncbi:MAG: hypothetical protein QOE54_5913 [Streptosporangiaceae bacterium]|jgi:hypothetical protein|nr:hypothetical protein [Streptosporangiaceae bacterium]MDX6433547.1 hypothetical protein [Streptosporangiaceae bacterium]